jgi:hypothetical protein
MEYDSAKETLYHIRRVSTLLHIICKGLLDRADNHDKTKIRYPEKAVFDKFTEKLNEVTYGSEKYGEYLAEMKPALADHYASNSHHPEHYKNGIDGMDLMDIVEMFCDWKAASERHEDGDLYKSIQHNRKRFGLSDQLAKIFENTIKGIHRE